MMSATTSTTRYASRLGVSATEAGTSARIQPKAAESLRKSNEFSATASVRGMRRANDPASKAPAARTRAMGSATCHERPPTTRQ